MKNIIRFALIAITLIIGTFANATTFEFSYTFKDGLVVSGTFDGTANGNVVTGISNASLYLNGTNIGKNLSVYSFQDGSDFWYNITAVATFNGDGTNIIIADGYRFASAENYFTIRAYGTPSSPTYYANLYSPEHYYNWSKSEMAGSTIREGWHLAAVGAVPEPETYAMLLAGLGLVTFACRKRITA
jgi:hypothetical protein